MPYSIVSAGEESNATLFANGAIYTAHSSSPNFEEIVSRLIQGDESQSTIDLFSVATAAAVKFDRLSERVTVKNGQLYIDGDLVNNVLSEQVVRFVREGVEDWVPLVSFFENIQANPNEHSREQLYRWLSAQDFSITDEGLIVGYKAVNRDGSVYRSLHSGPGVTVNDEPQAGNIPVEQRVGDVVEMARGDVNFDPTVGCSTGLHVGTPKYAYSFGGNTVLEVHVNPRDVVSVPTDAADQKIRCCRYVVVGEKSVPHTDAYVSSPFFVPVDLDEDWDDKDEDDECESEECDNYGCQGFC